LKLLVTLPAGLLLAGWLLFCSLPFVLNSFILPAILKNHDLEQLEVRIESLSPSSLTAQLALYHQGQMQFSLPHLRLNFNPFELAQGKLKNILVDGALLKINLEHGKLRIDGLPIRNANQPPVERAAVLDLHSIFPAFISKIELRNNQIVVAHGERADRVVLFDGTIEPTFHDSEHPVVKTLSLDLRTRGAVSASLTAKLEPGADSHSVEIAGKIEDLHQLPTVIAGFAERTKDLGLSGAALFTGSGKLAADFHSVEEISATLEASDFLLATGGLTLRSGATPLLLELTGHQQLLNYRLSELLINSQQTAAVSLAGTIAPKEKVLTGQGEITSELLKRPTAINVELARQDASYSGLVTLSGSSQSLAVANQEIRVGKYSLSSQIRMDEHDIRLQNAISLDSFDLPQLELAGDKLNSTFSYTVDLNAGTVEENSGGIIEVQSIQYKNETVATLQAEVEQVGQGFRLRGAATSQMAQPLTVDFQATLSPDSPVTGQLSMAAQPVSPGAFPPFVSLPEQIDFSGILAAQAQVEIRPQKTDWSLNLQLKDGEIRTKDNKVRLGGISSDLTFPGFANFASSPGQQLRIDNLELGNIKLDNGLITFHLENPGTIFIEKSRFTWCSGKVESGSMRVSLTEPEISTILYCDRLQFSELLGQLGISHASGNGSLNGRLPIYYSGKEMIFDDGFLFSTPGDSGIVRFNNTSMLRQGMGELDQTVYLDYSLQSMENFSYNWTKLAFNTKGEDLLIAMQIDGKPATPLPFGYKKGQLVKMEGAGIQHPIRLDVNFHLPFAQMFKYGQNLQKIMENM